MGNPGRWFCGLFRRGLRLSGLVHGLGAPPGIHAVRPLPDSFWPGCGTAECPSGAGCGIYPNMSLLSRIFLPTGNRRLNELIGFVVCVLALLLFLAVVSYSPLDPSLNSASVLTDTRAARNWIG